MWSCALWRLLVDKVIESVHLPFSVSLFREGFAYFSKTMPNHYFACVITTCSAVKESGYQTDMLARSSTHLWFKPSV